MGSESQRREEEHQEEAEAPLQQLRQSLVSPRPQGHHPRGERGDPSYPRSRTPAGIVVVPISGSKNVSQERPPATR